MIYIHFFGHNYLPKAQLSLLTRQLVLKTKANNYKTYYDFVSQILAAPCAAGVLSVDPPAAFGFLMVYYFLAETWFAIPFTVLVEIVPNEVRSVCIAIFLFLMNNVGGNLPVIVAPVADLRGLRFTLYIFWAGFVAASKLSKHNAWDENRND